MFCPCLMALLVLLPGDEPRQDRSAPALASSAEHFFQEGLKAGVGSPESTARFKQAFQELEALGRSGPRGSAFYLALGNTALLAGDIPNAILDYRQGLKGAPQARALSANLDYARALVIYPENSALGHPTGESWLPGPLRARTGPLFVLGLTLYCAGLLTFRSWWNNRQRAWGGGRAARSVSPAAGFFAPLSTLHAPRPSLIAIALAFLSFLTVGYATWLDREASRFPLVVIAKDGVVVRKGNAELYPSSFDTALNRGLEARLVSKRGNWLQIELANGQIGWIPEEAAVRERMRDETIQ